MMEEILENQFINQINRAFPEAPMRIHGTHEADAEIIDLGEAIPFYLAMTTDSICEEITSGLYQEPYLMGWMVATVNLSDLAAVGAKPIGLVTSLNIPEGVNRDALEELTRGITDATRMAETYVLGGDVNTAPNFMFSGCAIGTVPKKNLLTRIGCRPGEQVFITGPVGAGNAFALQQLMKKNWRITYQPQARIREGQIIREYASTCMDTSDGLFHTIDQLMRLNQCAIELSDHWEQMLDATALQISQEMGIPPWLMLAGCHGEFELCFTIPVDIRDDFLKAMKEIGSVPVEIGVVKKGEGVMIRSGADVLPIDTGYIRNLAFSTAGNPEEYISRLIEYAGSHHSSHPIGGKR